MNISKQKAITLYERIKNANLSSDLTIELLKQNNTIIELLLLISEDIFPLGVRLALVKDPQEQIIKYLKILEDKDTILSSYMLKLLQNKEIDNKKIIAYFEVLEKSLNKNCIAEVYKLLASSLLRAQNLEIASSQILLDASSSLRIKYIMEVLKKEEAIYASVALPGSQIIGSVEDDRVAFAIKRVLTDNLSLASSTSLDGAKILANSTPFSSREICNTLINEHLISRKESLSSARLLQSFQKKEIIFQLASRLLNDEVLIKLGLAFPLAYLFNKDALPSEYIQNVLSSNKIKKIVVGRLTLISRYIASSEGRDAFQSLLAKLNITSLDCPVDPLTIDWEEIEIILTIASSPENLVDLSDYLIVTENSIRRKIKLPS